MCLVLLWIEAVNNLDLSFLIGADYVPDGLGHLPAVFVDGEAVHEDLLERGLPPKSDTGQERRVEPSRELQRQL